MRNYYDYLTESNVKFFLALLFLREGLGFRLTV